MCLNDFCLMIDSGCDDVIHVETTDGSTATNRGRMELDFSNRLKAAATVAFGHKKYAICQGNPRSRIPVQRRSGSSLFPSSIASHGNRLCSWSESDQRDPFTRGPITSGGTRTRGERVSKTTLPGAPLQHEEAEREVIAQAGQDAVSSLVRAGELSM
ncbi:unnamed protein product [Protopolystoma xenopodis]|uniref:Uncharacterized protein n=1 Tax=Protopolystoma xenopodis TaxID=117903 RepID=A0A448XHR7_9PLAT|nr:unnamed protein product [Protopolystoma xenopodis]